MFEDDNQEVETSEDTQHNVEEDVELEVEETEDIEEAEEEAEPQIDWEARAKKAEAAIEKAKQKAKSAPSSPTSNLSPADIIALTKANIEPDDIQEVLDYAQYKRISVSQALQSSVVKATLAEAAEHRKSAAAVATPGRRASTGSISDEKLLANAKAGILPESEADLARLFDLRRKK